MKKGNKRTSDNSDIRVIDASNIPNGIERLVEVVKNNEKGNVVVKFYGPNKKRGCTVMVTKTKDHAVQFAFSLAQEVVKPLLDSFISGQGWTDLFKVPLSKTMQKAPGKTQICDKCDKRFASDKTLAIHVNSFHKNEMKHACELCAFKANNESDLTSHKDEEHENTRINGNR